VPLRTSSGFQFSFPGCTQRHNVWRPGAQEPACLLTCVFEFLAPKRLIIHVAPDDRREQLQNRKVSGHDIEEHRLQRAVRQIEECDRRAGTRLPGVTDEVCYTEDASKFPISA
jgi:hypothetical protein